jgi:Fic family protein
VRHLLEDEHLQLVIELISTEALKTSEIEGELLNRDSVQSSLRRQFGLQTDVRRVTPAERGIAEMLSDLYRGYAASLTQDLLFAWHRLVPDETDKYVVLAAMTLVNCIAFTPVPGSCLADGLRL